MSDATTSMHGTIVVGPEDGYPKRQVIDWTMSPTRVTFGDGDDAATFTATAFRITRDPFPWETGDDDA